MGKIFLSTKRIDCWVYVVVEKLKLTVALDQNFSEKELHKIAEALGGAFDLKERAYILKASEEHPPTAAFVFGQISGESLPRILGVIKSDYWKRAKKDVSKILSKRRRGEDPMVSFECEVENLNAKMRCRSGDRKIVEAALERLDSAIESLWVLSQKKSLPGPKAQVYLGFHEPTRSFRIDRAVVLGPEFGEYEYDEKTGKWSKVSLKQD